MNVKQHAENFAKEFLDDGFDEIDPDEFKACALVYLLAAKIWAEKAFEAAVNSRMSFKEWWNEINENQKA